MPEYAEILSDETCNGTLTFDTYAGLPQVPLQNAPAWTFYDLSDLWKLEVRGDNRTIDGLEGTRAYPDTLHEVTMQFGGTVVGKYDENGDLNVDPLAGLAQNLAYLRTNLELPISVGDGTRPVTWVREDGEVLLADVKVRPPLQHRVRLGAAAQVVLSIVVPRGRFTSSGS